MVALNIGVVLEEPVILNAEASMMKARADEKAEVPFIHSLKEIFGIYPVMTWNGPRS